MQFLQVKLPWGKRGPITNVILAKAGIHNAINYIDSDMQGELRSKRRQPGLRRNDEKGLGQLRLKSVTLNL